MTRRFLWFLVGWTLALLWLGSAVHATGSSLACPDWPTCFGVFDPPMEGGVFWEHLHRLSAGSLVLMFAAAVVLVRKRRPAQPGLFRLGLAGVAALLVQSVLGGLAVIYRLPDAISVSHLALAFGFLALATFMAARAGGASRARTEPRARRGPQQPVARAGVVMGCAVFAQSVAGALVRHMDAGMACPDIPLCLGRLVPPLDHRLVQVHYLHRVLAVVVAATVLRQAWIVWTRSPGVLARRVAGAAAGLVLLQVGVGLASVAFRLDPLVVSVHTLLAAILIVLSVTLAAQQRVVDPATAERPPNQRNAPSAEGTAA